MEIFGRYFYFDSCEVVDAWIQNFAFAGWGRQYLRGCEYWMDRWKHNTGCGEVLLVDSFRVRC